MFRRSGGLRLRWVSPSLTRCFWLLILALVNFQSTQASAYQWMLRHGYDGCATCHVDPSGAGVLEPYGSAIASQLLPTQFAGSGQDASGDTADDRMSLPEPLRLQADVRGLYLARKVEGFPLESDFIWMQADLAAALELDQFVASASFGYADQGATLAAVTRGAKYNLVSRQHWVGIWAPDRVALVRAGRFNLPFGVRTIEHNLWVRDLTSTSINDHQSHGASVHWGTERLRGELMAVAGNFQVRPDAYRERGYSAYAELIALPGLALGASSLLLHRKLDERALVPTWRHAHGIFARWATPHAPLALAAEADYVLATPRHQEHQKGLVAYMQADYELVQGVHLMATGELNNFGVAEQPASFAGWFSYAWYLLPNADIRFDSVYYSLGSRSRNTRALAMLMQFHVYL